MESNKKNAANSEKGERRMYAEYKCPKCNTTGHAELHRIGEGENDGLYTCLACWREWAEDYKRKGVTTWSESKKS
jgi:DNA-directed RNA polymerase subunit RPC12/RpoP